MNAPRCLGLVASRVRELPIEIVVRSHWHHVELRASTRSVRLALLRQQQSHVVTSCGGGRGLAYVLMGVLRVLVLWVEMDEQCELLEMGER